MDGILGILFIPAKGFLLCALRGLGTYRVTPGSRGRLSLRSVFALSLYLNFKRTYRPTGGHDTVCELYLMSRCKRPPDPAARGAP